jgi:hypothetical protein
MPRRLTPVGGSPLLIQQQQTAPTAPTSPPGSGGPYAAIVAADAPVAWYRLNETSGTTAADSGSGTPAPGTYANSPTLGLKGIAYGDSSTNLAVGMLAQGHVNVGALPAKLQFTAGTDFTIEAWVFIPYGVTNPGEAIVTEAYAGDGTVRYMLGFYDGNTNTLKPTFGWFNGAWRLAVAGSAISTDAWHHLAGTYDAAGNQLQLWVDGAAAATLTPGGTQPDGTETLYLGRRWDSGSQVNAVVDEIAFYGYRLSSAQITSHYQAKNAALYTDLAVTSLWIEAAIAGPTPDTRVTSLWIEVATEEFAHGFGYAEQGSGDMTYGDPEVGIGPNQPGFILAGAASSRAHGRATAQGA